MKPALGILGGGQLAMMMCHAARRLNITTVVVSPDPDAPAREACDQFVHGEYTATESLEQLTAKCSVVTIDNEHIPLDALRKVAATTPTFPTINSLACIQDRLQQRTLLERLEIPQVRYRSVDKRAAVRTAMRAETFPAVLKTRHGGYDGYGQVKVDQPEDLQQAWKKLKEAPCVLESWVHDIREFSLIGTRNAAGTLRIYPPIMNVHKEGQLHYSSIPMQLDARSHALALEQWNRIAVAQGGCGLLTVEFFLLPNGDVLVNEIAPRVHNSGHVTQWAAMHDQFEMHVRAVCGLETPDPEVHREGAMINIYPEHPCSDPAKAPDWQKRFGGVIVLYGKEPRPNRKLGHWNLPPEKLQTALLALEETPPAVAGSLPGSDRNSLRCGETQLEAIRML